MNSLIGFILVAIAAATVVIVLYLVVNEKHHQEEHYLPPTESDPPAAEAEPLSDNALTAASAPELSPTSDEEQPKTE